MCALLWNRLELSYLGILLWIWITIFSFRQGCSSSTVYVGCYRDNSTKRVMQAVGDQATHNMTLDVCRQRCLAGSQGTYLGTEWYYECYCGDHYDRLGSLPNSTCNTPCAGNSAQTCGGDRALSVHTVCLRGYYDGTFTGQRCTERCHCLDDAWCIRRNGTCPRGCAEGWEGHNCSQDENECSRRPNPCRKANQNKCINTVGSYNCTCDDGFQFSTYYKTCEDIDECRTTNHRCETDPAVGSCVNTQGSYRCECSAGYRLKSDGKCEDIDECSSGTHACTQICINTRPWYTCDCAGGYELQSDRITCQDIDECTAWPDKAGCEQECNNTEGSFHCYCRPGYEVSQYNSFLCTDINECLVNKGGCSHDCINTAGSYTCGCRAGYELMSDRHECQDIIECDSSNGGCEHNCTNKPGSYECSCNSGYLLLQDKHNCQDVDECFNTSLHQCDRDQGDCTNLPGLYECGCTEGYQLRDQSLVRPRPDVISVCEDIDECAPEKRDETCGENQNCTNTRGAFICHCNDGYTQEGNGTCQEILLNSAGHWKIALAVLSVILIISIVVVLIIIARSKRDDREKGMIVEDRMLTPPVIVETKLDSKPTAPAKNKKPLISPKAAPSDDGNRSDGYDNDAMNAIYANFTPPATAKSPTRITVADLPALIQRVREMPQALSDEFKKLKESSGDSISFAEQKELKPKNRFKNILPYDHNRVKLSQIGKDSKTTYINASFVKGYKEEAKFIASHGPIQSTIGDFWRMVWEYKSYLIVMVTKCKEDLKMKCELYWPEDAQPLELDNGLFIKLCSADHWLDHVQRKFTLTNSEGETRDIVHIQYLAWPDHGVPHHSISLLSLRHKARSLFKSGNSSPIVVHCSAGVGRTGTYIALDNLLEEAEDKREIDIHTTVLNLRKQRMNCVQTLDQYTFIFKALYEGLIMGVTRIPSSQIHARVRALKSSHPITGKSVLESEFNMISEMQPLYSDEQCSDALSHVNKKKNRTSSIVPPNFQRVFLSSGNNTDYINAVFVSSHQKQDCYIATQFPLKNTVGDFWTMCLDYNSAVVVVLSKDGQDDDALLEMLPQSGVWLRFGKLSVGNTQLEQQLGPSRNNSNSSRAAAEICWETYTVTIQHGTADPETCIYENTKAGPETRVPEEEGKEVKVKVLVASLPQSLSAMDESLLRISREVTSLVNEEQAPVIVTCRTGVGLCGPYIAASNCYTMVQSDDVIDVVQIVLDLKKAQPHFIRTQDDYEQIYNIAELCSNQTSTYANVL